MRRILLIILVLVLAASGWGIWRYVERDPNQGELKLYGNVDLRQVELPFNNSGRIAEVLAQEGDRVAAAQLLARLDTSRLEPAVAQAEAQVAAQREVVARMHNGSRPEEIAQARANVESAEADARNARRQFDRYEKLTSGRAASQQDFDNAKAALDVAEAKLQVNRKALELSLAGPRQEEVRQAEAELRASDAQLALLNQELADARLLAPTGAVVRARLMEPGEMASPQRPIYSLAITDPKWVRAFVSESELGRIRPGQNARITVDSFPDRAFAGWVGFISPVAEFTPKTVQTEELRTSLVYEVRVFVTDPNDDLRLGMPATVRLEPGLRTDVPTPERQPVEAARATTTHAPVSTATDEP